MDRKLQHLLPEVSALCQRYGVQRLALFGSAASCDTLAPESDYDFTVEWDPRAEGSRAMRWIALAEALEALLGQHVDLVNPSYIRNPFFKASVNAGRIPLFEAP